MMSNSPDPQAELRQALENIWGGGIDYALSPDFKELTPDEKDALYIRYRDNLIARAEALITAHTNNLLAGIESKLPEDVDTHSFLTVPYAHASKGAKDQARGMADGFHEAIKEVKSILATYKGKEEI